MVNLNQLNILIPFPGYEEANNYLESLEEVLAFLNINYSYLLLVSQEGIDLQLDILR